MDLIEKFRQDIAIARAEDASRRVNGRIVKPEPEDRIDKAARALQARYATNGVNHYNYEFYYQMATVAIEAYEA